jgi:sec-independent protein translocase protein TatC
MSSEQNNPGVPGTGKPEPANPPEPAAQSAYTPTVDDTYGYYDDPYAYESNAVTTTAPPAAQEQPANPPPPPPPPPSSPSEEDEEEVDDGMLRMSFLEHLEELRARLMSSVIGMAVAFVVSLTFCNELWKVVSAPAIDALTQLGANPPKLAQLTPMEAFSTVWVKLPLLTSIFLASPWILWQVWSFIAPGLYKKERRMAAPFVLISAGLFISGGLFAYFVAFRFGLVFLLGIGRDLGIAPLVSVSEYFNLFVNVTLGIALVFELPILIFFLTLLRVASPRFLLEHSRYAVLLIVVAAAVITPTPDIFNLMIFSVPMVLLYFVGVFASYLLVLSREGRRFPWSKVLLGALVVLALSAAGLYIAVSRYGYKLVPQFPFLIR